MTSPHPDGPRLIVFDCDGTLVDSLFAIQHAMQRGFESIGMDAPTPDAVRGIVGLSVPQAVAALAPGHPPETLAALDRAFRASAIAHRETGPEADGQLYPGTRAALDRLTTPETLMAVATGKARRGLEHTLDAFALRPFFIATQTADDAPSKPHPGMLQNCERLTGIAPARTAMVGDTTFDIAMARAHGCIAIGVSWGYHPVAALREAGAHVVIDDFADLDAALETLL